MMMIYMSGDYPLYEEALKKDDPHLTISQLNPRTNHSFLLWAVQRGAVRCTRWCLENGWSATKDPFDGYPPLSYTVHGGKGVCKLLVQHGADPKYQYLNGYHLLDYALLKYPIHRDVAEYLIKHGARMPQNPNVEATFLEELRRRIRACAKAICAFKLATKGVLPKDFVAYFCRVFVWPKRMSKKW